MRHKLQEHTQASRDDRNHHLPRTLECPPLCQCTESARPSAVSFVALVSFVPLIHLPSLCDRVGLRIGDVVGPIHLQRFPLPLVSIFQCSLFSLCLGCAWLKHRPPALARPSVVLVPVRKFCMSVVDTLTLHFSFFSTGSGVPIPGCLFTGFLGPDAWMFSSWVLGSHSLAVFLSYHHL